jgi:hypothetical protein
MPCRCHAINRLISTHDRIRNGIIIGFAAPVLLSFTYATMNIFGSNSTRESNPYKSERVQEAESLSVASNRINEEARELRARNTGSLGQTFNEHVSEAAQALEVLACSFDARREEIESSEDYQQFAKWNNANVRPYLERTRLYIYTGFASIFAGIGLGLVNNMVKDRRLNNAYDTLDDIGDSCE